MGVLGYTGGMLAFSAFRLRLRSWHKPAVRIFATLLLGLGAVLPATASDSGSNILTKGFSGNQFAVSQTDDFLPVDEAYQLLVERQSGGELSISWSIAEGYYLYRHAFSAQAQTEGGKLQDLPLQIPPGQAKHDEYFGDVEVYYLNASVNAAIESGTPAFSITYQGCADAGLCYPPTTRYFALLNNGSAEAVGNFPGAEVNSTAAMTAESLSSPGLAQPSFLLMALFAFLGGMILNLMPCVFPVLALKVLGLVNAGSVSLAEQRAHGFSYTAGVVSSFLLVASVLLVLRSAGEALGWGFQLQTPWLVAALAYLFFVLALSMSGYIEFGGALAGVGQNLTERSGHSGSFFTGVLAVVVASPCTAPFMGAALGFALVQPPVLALTIFAALGFGMAAPFLLLVGMPGLARLLPRPGAWMVTFKQLMAIPLYITVVWLLWVVGRQTNVDGMAIVLCGCVIIYTALWLWRGPGVARKLVSGLVALIAVSLLSGPWLDSGTAAGQKMANAYSADKVLELRSQGKPVFVNLTADWCITCLANERVALSQQSVLEEFSANNVAYLKGDWTNSDPTITELLKQFGRSGVPLYLLYPAELSEPAVVLPQLLTPTIVIDAVRSINGVAERGLGNTALAQ